MTVCIISKNELLTDALRLELSSSSVAVFTSSEGEGLPSANAYFWDMDTIPSLPPLEGQLIASAWDKEKPEGFSGIWLDRPFRPARLKAVLGLYNEENTDDTLYPVHSRRSVLMQGEEIPLTEGEFRLFCCLSDAKGEYVSREALHNAVWNGKGDEGIVTVYIHYLRRKLEKQGKKLFYSARGRGYAYFEKGREA